MSSHSLCVPSHTEPGPLRARDVELARMPVYTSDHYPNDRPPQTCDVCYEDLGPQALYRQLPCQHTFHKACIDQWICKRDASCPFCRRTFYHLRQPFAIYKAATGPMHVRTEEDKTRGLGDTLASWWRRLA